MTLRSIIAIAASCSLLLSCSQSTPETIVVPLEKANESLTRGLAYWMNGNMEVTRDSDYPERVTSVKTTLHGTIPVEAIFNEDNTITYKFPDRYETINVPVDSMRVYRKRARFELDGPTPNWKIGEYPTGDSNYEVWVKPDGNVSFNDNDFFNDFAIYAQIGNVYKGSVNAPDGDVYLTIEHSMDNQTPTIIFPVGKYEDFSSFRPEINGGLITRMFSSTFQN